MLYNTKNKTISPALVVGEIYLFSWDETINILILMCNELNLGLWKPIMANSIIEYIYIYYRCNHKILIASLSDDKYRNNFIYELRFDYE